MKKGDKVRCIRTEDTDMDGDTIYEVVSGDNNNNMIVKYPNGRVVNWKTDRFAYYDKVEPKATFRRIVLE